VRYSLPAATVLLCFLLQLGLQTLIPKERDFPYAMFYLSGLIGVAWLGGYGPGALGVVLTIVGIPALTSQTFSPSAIDWCSGSVC
jgi:hypothetical protein